MRKALFTAAAVIAAVIAVSLALLPAGLAPAGEHAILSPVSPLDKPSLPLPHPYNDELPAKGKFLVASPTIADPRFQEAVVLLIAYDVTGATGLIINRPSEVTLAEALMSVPGLKDRSDVVFYGGPVEGKRVFMLLRSREKPDESDNMFADVYVSMSRKTLESMIGARKTQKQFRVYSGYAGWFPGQLNREVSRGDWYIINADADSIFEKDSSGIWQELIRWNSGIEVWKHDKEKRLTS